MNAAPDFLLELGVLLLVLGAAGALAWRAGLSAVPLFLLAGLAVGEGGVFPAPSAGAFLDGAASIGVVLAHAESWPGVLHRRVQFRVASARSQRRG